jgi:hypothetical protein
MVVIGPYRALIINVNDLKSATEGRPCIRTRENHNERETHFLYRPANLRSLKIFFALCALFALGSRIWRYLVCVKSSKSMAEAVAFIELYLDALETSDCSLGRQTSKYECHLTKVEVHQTPLICMHGRLSRPKRQLKCTNKIDASLDIVSDQ